MNKKRGLFDGFFDVFEFTAGQTIKGKGFKGATIGVSVILFALLFAVNMIIMFTNKDEKDNFKEDINNDLVVEQVECNLTKLNIYNATEVIISKDKVVTFLQSATNKTLETDVVEVLAFDKPVTKEQIKEIAKDVENVAYVYVSKDETGAYNVDYYEKTDENSDVAHVITSFIRSEISTFMINELGLSTEELPMVLTSHVVSVYEAGENRNVGVMLVKLFLPMVVCFLLYMMVIMNGQSITKAVIAEKTSKLMETLLTSARPYAVIAGKVLGMAGIALMQMFIYIISGVLGFFAGDYVATKIDPNYNNVVMDVFDLIADSAQGAFSIQAIIIAVLFLVVGFYFYCTLAAFAASWLGKPEDLSNALALFQLPVVVAFIGAYLAPLVGNDLLLGIVRIFPLSSPFSVTADVLTGEVTIAMALLSFALLLVVTVAITLLTGKVYKSRIFGKS